MLPGPSGLGPRLLRLWLILLEPIRWQNLFVNRFGGWVYNLIRRSNVLEWVVERVSWGETTDTSVMPLNMF